MATSYTSPTQRERQRLPSGHQDGELCPDLYISCLVFGESFALHCTFALKQVQNFAFVYVF